MARGCPLPPGAFLVGEKGISNEAKPKSKILESTEVWKVYLPTE